MKTRQGRGWSYHLLLLGSLVFAVIMVLVSTTRQLSPLEGTLFQIVTLGLGIVWGAQFASRQAQPHARSAFRRIVGLYKSLARIRTHLQQAPDIYRIEGEAKLALHMLENIVIEQLATAEDAQADWKEMLSEKEIKAIIASPDQASLRDKEKGNGED